MVPGPIEPLPDSRPREEVAVSVYVPPALPTSNCPKVGGVEVPVPPLVGETGTERLMVPDVVIVPPVSPVPAVIAVTLPDPLPHGTPVLVAIFPDVSCKHPPGVGPVNLKGVFTFICVILLEPS